MGGPDLLLCVEVPCINLATANQNIVGPLIKQDRSQSILDLILEGLNAVECFVPDFDSLIGTQRDKMMSIFIHSKVLNRSIVCAERVDHYKQ